MLQLLRRQMVHAVHAGMTQTEAAATFGASLRAVSKWMVFERAGGLRDLKLKRRGHRPGAGRLPEKADAAHPGEGDRPDARSVETAVLSRDALGGERGVLSLWCFRASLRHRSSFKFLRQSLKQSQGRIYLVVEGHPVHRSGEVRRFVEQNGGGCGLFACRATAWD